MELILMLVYVVLLILALIYGGLIVYHIVKYRAELYDGQIPRATAAMWFYMILGSSILVLSVIFAGLGSAILSI